MKDFNAVYKPKVETIPFRTSTSTLSSVEQLSKEIKLRVDVRITISHVSMFR
jgi:hypothetical protein